MKYNKLGHSDLVVSQVALGGMSLRGTSKQNSDLVKMAVEGGINLVDTADMYDHGLNESLIGDSLKGIRSQVILSTKVGNQWREDGSGWDWRASKAYILKNVDSSLSRLQTDYIDLYQLHGGMIDDQHDDIMEAFELLVQAGKIRYYGLSSIRPNVIRHYLDHSSIATLMMPYSVLDRRSDVFFERCTAAHISILTRGSLAQGLLLDKQATAFLELSSSEVLHAQRNIQAAAAAASVSPLAVCLAYATAPQAVGAAVVGVRAVAQLKELLKAIAEIPSVHAGFPIDKGIRKFAFTDHL